MSDTSFGKKSITTDAARRVLDAGIAYARGQGRAFVLAVVDEAGVLKAFDRMDGAPQLSVQIAQDKAYSAAAFGMPTDQWFDFIKDDGPLLHGIVHTDRLVIFGGGLPIVEDGQVIGAIGVSGGHYTEDLEVAKAALQALESQ